MEDAHIEELSPSIEINTILCNLPYRRSAWLFSKSQTFNKIRSTKLVSLGQWVSSSRTRNSIRDELRSLWYRFQLEVSAYRAFVQILFIRMGIAPLLSKASSWMLLAYVFRYKPNAFHLTKVVERVRERPRQQHAVVTQRRFIELRAIWALNIWLYIWPWKWLTLFLHPGKCAARPCCNHWARNWLFTAWSVVTRPLRHDRDCDAYERLSLTVPRTPSEANEKFGRCSHTADISCHRTCLFRFKPAKVHAYAFWAFWIEFTRPYTFKDVV